MKTKKHWGKSVIMKRLNNGEVVTLHLERGDTAWNPAKSANASWCWLRGQAVVEYRQFGDGGIDVRIKDG